MTDLTARQLRAREREIVAELAAREPEMTASEKAAAQLLRTPPAGRGWQS